MYYFVFMLALINFIENYLLKGGGSARNGTAFKFKSFG